MLFFKKKEDQIFLLYIYLYVFKVFINLLIYIYFIYIKKLKYIIKRKYKIYYFNYIGFKTFYNLKKFSMAIIL